ncbi:MAG: hypothetical protein MRY83_22390 [Flavobacteriales bacterium]|nr:hypothetical protein [Flavobacteriales bacterium]
MMNLKQYISSHLPNEINGYELFNQFLSETKEQLKKDALLQGFQLNLSNEITNYKELLFELQNQLNEMLENRNSKILKGLLYQTDVNEHDLMKNFEKTPIEDHSEILGKMIVERALKKVLTRYYFKNLE